MYSKIYLFLKYSFMVFSIVTRLCITELFLEYVKHKQDLKIVTV